MTNANTQNWLLDAGKKEALTYSVKEDNAGGLHMLLYREELNIAHLVAACLNIRPEDIKTCIEDIDNWTTWEGLVDITDYEREICAIRDQCVTVEKTRIEPLGLVRVTHWDRMGEAAKQAFKDRAQNVFGGAYKMPAYVEPILRDFITARVSVKWSIPCKVSGFDEPVSRVWFSGAALYCCKTQIAVVDRRSHVLVISGQRYSASISRVQNGVESWARRWNVNVYYALPSLPLDKVFS